MAAAKGNVAAGERPADDHQKEVINEDTKVFTRRGNEWTRRFKKIAADAYLINAGSAIIDGEIVVPAADGSTDFSVLQNELRGKSAKIVMAFDLLYLNGYDLRKLPLVERKAHLKKLIANTDFQFSETFEVDGSEMYQHAPRWDSRASSPRFAIARTGQDQRETLPIAGFSLDDNDWDGRLAREDEEVAVRS